jgi:RNA polymerase sigma factor (sigma-70 family)
MLASSNLTDKRDSRKEESFTGLGKYCSFLTKNKWESDDLFQSTLLKAIQTYEPEQLTEPLLKKIAYHQWIDTVRKRKFEVVGIPDEQASPDSSTSTESKLDAVNHLLQKLTLKQAVIFTLREAFNYQAKEIAEIVGTSEMAIKSLLHRARKRLEYEHLRPLTDQVESTEIDVLYSLLHESLQREDPAILIKHLHQIPSLEDVRKLASQKHSSSTPLNPYCMAA